MLKKLLITAVVCVSVAQTAFAKTEVYTFDPMHTAVTWSASHFGFSNPSGKFTDVTGELKIDEHNPKNSKVHAIISIKSLATGLLAFDEHLRSKDFFNAEKHPIAEFKSSKVEVMPDGKAAKVHGKLTILGVTKPVVLDVKFNKSGVNPYFKKDVMGFSADAIVKRSEYGMKMGIPDIADEIPVHIEAELFKK